MCLINLAIIKGQVRRCHANTHFTVICDCGQNPIQKSQVKKFCQVKGQAVLRNVQLIND